MCRNNKQDQTKNLSLFRNSGEKKQATRIMLKMEENALITKKNGSSTPNLTANKTHTQAHTWGRGKWTQQANKETIDEHFIIILIDYKFADYSNSYLP